MNNSALARMSEATGMSRSQIEVIKNTIAKNASDDELMLFVNIAQRTGLDPFSRQIYLIERREKVDDQWKTTRQPMTSIDGLRLIADRTDRYAPGRAPTFTYDGDGKLATATAYVMKFVRNQWHEVAATAHYEEYVQTKKDGAPNTFWANKPHIMLAKCAEALALRRAFPADMSGVYTADEFRDEPPAMPPPRRVDTATGEVIDAEPSPATFDDEKARALEGARHWFRQAKVAGLIDADAAEQAKKLPEYTTAEIVSIAGAWQAAVQASQEQEPELEHAAA